MSTTEISSTAGDKKVVKKVKKIKKTGEGGTVVESTTTTTTVTSSSEVTDGEAISQENKENDKRYSHGREDPSP